jgi:hypothetical protein
MAPVQKSASPPDHRRPNLSGQFPYLQAGAGIRVFWFFSSEKNRFFFF